MAPGSLVLSSSKYSLKKINVRKDIEVESVTREVPLRFAEKASGKTKNLNTNKDYKSTIN